MSESLPAGPAMSDEEARGGGWMHFVLPQPSTVGGRDTKRLLRQAAGECGAWAVVIIVAAALLAPVLGFAVAGGWAIYTYISTLLALWRNVKAYQLSNLAPLLHTLDVAARVALVSAGYFALLAALIVLMAGLLGTRWRRLFLFPGFTFTLPSALAFFFGFRLSLDVQTATLHTSVAAQTALLAYLLLDAILLAAALVDISPRRARRAWGIGWLRWRWRRRYPAPLAPLHFGPSAPPSAHSVELVLALVSSEECPAEQEQTAQEALRLEALRLEALRLEAPRPKAPTLDTSRSIEVDSGSSERSHDASDTDAICLAREDMHEDIEDISDSTDEAGLLPERSALRERAEPLPAAPARV